MFEILIFTLKTYGLSLFGGLGTGLLYFYWMRYSIRIAVQKKYVFGWLAFFTLLRLVCMGTLLFAVIQQGLGMLVCFMIGFTTARFILVSLAVEETEEKKHAV